MITTRKNKKLKNLKAQVLVDLVVETSFEKWAKPGHFSRTLAKGPKQQHGFGIYMQMHMILICKQNL
jgi:hypothetical protein